MENRADSQQFNAPIRPAPQAVDGTLNPLLALVCYFISSDVFVSLLIEKSSLLL